MASLFNTRVNASVGALAPNYVAPPRGGGIEHLRTWLETTHRGLNDSLAELHRFAALMGGEEVESDAAMLWTGVHTHETYVDYVEISAPATPSTNRARLYAKDKAGVSTLYYKRDNGDEIELLAGGGGGPFVGGTGVATRVAFWLDANNITSDAALYWDNVNKRLGVNAGTTPAARIHAIDTTEVARLGFDVSNYVSVAVASDGKTTYTAVGAGAKHRFNTFTGIADDADAMLTVRNIAAVGPGLGTPYAWYKADAIGGLVAGNNITTWTDLSGNGRTLTGAGINSDGTATALRPKWYPAGHASGIPNLAVARFDNVAGAPNSFAYFAFPSLQTLSSTTGFTIALIVKHFGGNGNTVYFGQAPGDAGTTFKNLYDDPSSGTTNLIQSDESSIGKLWSVAHSYTHGTTIGGYVMRKDSNSAGNKPHTWLNGTDVSVGGATTFTNDFTVSKFGVYGVSASNWTSIKSSWVIAEIIIYDRPLTAGEITTLNAYLAQRIAGTAATSAYDLTRWKELGGTTLSRVNASGWLGVGVDPTQPIHVRTDQAATTKIMVENYSSADGAIAEVNLNAGSAGPTTTASMFFQAFGSATTATEAGLTLASWTRLRSSSVGNGLLIAQGGVKPIVIGVNNTEIARWTSTGYGIGTTAPATKEHIVGGGLRVEASTGQTAPLLELMYDAGGVPKRMVRVRAQDGIIELGSLDGSSADAIFEVTPGADNASDTALTFRTSTTLTAAYPFRWMDGQSNKEYMKFGPQGGIAFGYNAPLSVTTPWEASILASMNTAPNFYNGFLGLSTEDTTVNSSTIGAAGAYGQVAVQVQAMTTGVRKAFYAGVMGAWSAYGGGSGTQSPNDVGAREIAAFFAFQGQPSSAPFVAHTKSIAGLSGNWARASGYRVPAASRGSKSGNVWTNLAIGVSAAIPYFSTTENWAFEAEAPSYSGAGATLANAIMGAAKLNFPSIATTANRRTHVYFVPTSETADITTFYNNVEGDVAYFPDASPYLVTGLYEHDTVDWKRLRPGWFVQTANKTVANTVTETTLLTTGQGRIAIPNDYLIVGRTIRCRLSGFISDTGTPTLNIKVKLGSVTLAQTTAIALAGTVTNNVWELVFDLAVRTVGATGTMIGQGRFWYDNTTQTGAHWGLPMTAAATIDTTVANSLDVTATWGAADVANTITCTNVLMEVLDG